MTGRGKIFGESIRVGRLQREQKQKRYLHPTAFSSMDCMGIVTRKQVPRFFGSLYSNVTSPPKARAYRRQMESPRPVPSMGDLVVNPASKTFSNSSWGTPTEPESITSRKSVVPRTSV